jgi:hypothetical protein
MKDTWSALYREYVKATYDRRHGKPIPLFDGPLYDGFHERVASPELIRSNVAELAKLFGIASHLWPSDTDAYRWAVCLATLYRRLSVIRENGLVKGRKFKFRGVPNHDYEYEILGNTPDFLLNVKGRSAPQHPLWCV